MIVDVRTALQFDEAHIPGAVCITMLSQGFGTKLSWVADPSQEIVLVGRDDDDARRAALLATAVGVRTLSGFLSGDDELAGGAPRGQLDHALDRRGAGRPDGHRRCR